MDDDVAENDAGANVCAVEENLHESNAEVSGQSRDEGRRARGRTPSSRSMTTWGGPRRESDPSFGPSSLSASVRLWGYVRTFWRSFPLL